MKELSLNVLDLAQNSITAGATRLDIELAESAVSDSLRFKISDNGCGMEPEFLRLVTDPFTTTRTTRRVGMGIPLLKMTSEMAGGGFTIRSEKGKGTVLEASFGLSNIDRPPVGDMPGTLVALVQGSPQLSLRYKRSTDSGCFTLSTDELRKELGGVSLAEPEVLSWLGEYIAAGEAELKAAD